LLDNKKNAGSYETLVRSQLDVTSPFTHARLYTFSETPERSEGGIRTLKRVLNGGRFHDGRVLRSGTQGGKMHSEKHTLKNALEKHTCKNVLEKKNRRPKKTRGKMHLGKNTPGKKALGKKTHLEKSTWENALGKTHVEKCTWEKTHVEKSTWGRKKNGDQKNPYRVFDKRPQAHPVV